MKWSWCCLTAFPPAFPLEFGYTHFMQRRNSIMMWCLHGWRFLAPNDEIPCSPLFWGDGNCDYHHLLDDQICHGGIQYVMWCLLFWLILDLSDIYMWWVKSYMKNDTANALFRWMTMATELMSSCSSNIWLSQLCKHIHAPVAHHYHLSDSTKRSVMRNSSKRRPWDLDKRWALSS